MKKINYVEYKHSYCHALEPKLNVIKMKACVEKRPVNYIKGIIKNTLNQSKEVIWTEKEQTFFDNVMQHVDATQLYYYCKNAINKAKETIVTVDDEGELIA